MKNKNWFKELIPYIVIIIVVLFIKQFIVTTVIVHGPSMQNTLHDKDIMILDKIGIKTRGIKRFDIVVIDIGTEKIIKRVIGLPNETVSYKDNKLYIDGNLIEENYSDKYTADIDDQILGNNQYYVLGDNRTNSLDSRVIGPISKDKIIGHAKFIIFPFTRFGRK